jgi:hypothetical protein
VWERLAAFSRLVVFDKRGTRPIRAHREDPHARATNG